MTPLNSTEVADYLRDRLEAVGAEHVERIFPAVTMRSIAQASRGVIALCEAIARRSLERTAATDCQTVTTEIVEEVATIYSGPPADVRQVRTMLRRLPSALTSGPVPLWSRSRSPWPRSKSARARSEGYLSRPAWRR
jgi:hypothetical protein